MSETKAAQPVFPPISRRYPAARLPHQKSQPFDIELSAQELSALAEWLGARSVRKFRAEGEIAPEGDHGFVVHMTLGVTVTQDCIASGAPVRTRIYTVIERHFAPRRAGLPKDLEIELDAEDEPDPLGDAIDLGEIIAESILLELPDYPRAPDAETGFDENSGEIAEDSSQQTAKPFASLAALHKKLLEGEGEP